MANIGKYSEEDIIKGCKKADPKMQEALYNAYAGKMISVCSRYTNNRMEAEDVFHDTFIKVFEKIKGFNGGNLTSWMYRVFINSSIDYYKSQLKHFNHVEISNFRLEDENQLSVLCKLSADELTQIINQLPLGYKMVFNMYVVDGYSHSEIGEKLNISVGTSKSQLFKAKNMLISLLEANNISRYA